MKKRIVVVAVLVAAIYGIRQLLRNRQQLGEFCCGRFPAGKDAPATVTEPDITVQVA